MTDGDDHDLEVPPPAAFELRSYGRRRGRKLSPRQQKLMDEFLPVVSPRLGDASPVDAEACRQLFRHPVEKTWLEIGFGGGEHLLWQARENPLTGIIGAEPFEDGVVKVLAAVEDERLGNVLVHADDVRALLRWLPQNSLQRIFILFPDPWPKRRHVKRRLVNRHLLQQVVRVLEPGGELRLATDIGDYARTMLMALSATPELAWAASEAKDWRERPDGWPGTRYEAKARREGRSCYFLRFICRKC